MVAARPNKRALAAPGRRHGPQNGGQYQTMEGGDNMKKRLWHFLTDETAATAVEYGIMIAAIAATIIGTVTILGGEIKTAFETINANMP